MEMTMMMEMENNAKVESSGTEEEEFGRGSIRRNHPQIIAKRKRTKRRRLSGINVVSNSISSTDFGGEKDRNYESSVTTTTTTTEEEEDMANCLIMLARSGSRRRSFSNENDEVNFNKSLVKTVTEIKKTISSSSSLLIPNGVDGNVLYECKTCDKAFQSFQALGGHRASHHKKAKSLFPDDTTTTTTTAVNTKIKAPIAKTSAILHVNKQPSSSKLHECAICGSAFSSGQALGGHMRRHRATTTTTAVAAVDAELTHTENVAVLVSDRYIENDDNDNNNNKFLASLDLNMPAPAEEDQEEDDQMSHNQRRMLFATTVQDSGNPSTTIAPPSLVGCYF